MRNTLLMNEKTFVGIRMTIANETVDKQVELIEFFSKHGFKHIASEPVFTPVKAESVAGRITQVDLRVYIKNFVEA